MKLLVPLDESDVSLSILPAVRRLLEPYLRADSRLAGLLALLPDANVPDQPIPSAEVHFLTVLSPRHELRTSSSTALPEEFETALLAPAARQRSEQKAGTRLASIARNHFADVNTACHVPWSESPAETIVELADSLDVDAIVMATHGRSAVGRLVAGSVAEGVIRKSKRPVVVQRPAMEHGHSVQPNAGAVGV